MSKEELIEDILDIINSENSGLSYQQRLNEIEKTVIDIKRPEELEKQTEA
jgi:hypothetical protein